MNKALRGLALGLVVTLAACGGGGDEPPAQAVSTCAVEALATGQQVGRVLVASDTYAFPTTSALQDRTFSATTFTNSAAAAVRVQVQVTAQRTLAASAGMGGGMRFFVGVLDVTANQLVGTAANSCADDITGLHAGAQVSVTENRVYTLTVPAGHTFTFTPFARALPDGLMATNDPFVLTTTNFDLRLVAL